MSSPVRLSRSRRILSRSGNHPSVRSKGASSSSSPTPRASVYDDPDDSPGPRPSLGVRQSASPSHSRHSRISAKLASRRRSDSRSDNAQEVRHASPAHLHLPRQTRFGIPAPTNQPKVIGNFDFEEKYPEDPIYEELGPNARVWRANLDECEVFDNDMVTEARDGLDLILVFAGLFSAVLTTFVAQTSQALSNNFPAVSTALLLEMVTLQRALINGSSIDNVSTSEMSSGPSGFEIWVNALWFTSLTLSLGTALIAVLVKQWLYQYMSHISGTARDRSLIRFYRFDGLRKWHVLTIIGVLPIVLHIALGLFLIGLVVLLVPLNTPLAIVVGFMTVVICSMHAISNVLPILYTQCPYRTPFSDIFNIMLRPLLAFLSSVATSRACGRVVVIVRSIFASVSDVKHFTLPLRTSLMSGMSSAAARIHKFIPLSSIIDAHSTSDTRFTSDTRPTPKEAFRTLKEAERIAATNDAVTEELASDALSWLCQVTSNPPTKSVVLQSIGCLSDNVTGRLAAICADMDHALVDIQQYTGALNRWSILPGQETRAERLLRSNRHNHRQHAVTNPQFWELDKDIHEYHFQLPLSILTHSLPCRSEIVFTGQVGIWGCTDFLVHILRYDTTESIIFPSLLWRRLFRAYLDQSGSEGGLLVTETDLSFKLCRLALRSLDNGIQIDNPFPGGVPITHHTIPLLDFIMDILPHAHSANTNSSKLLQQLLTMNNFIVSTCDDLATNCGIPLELIDIWKKLCQPRHLSPGDRQVLCHRAEELILQVFIDGWSGEHILKDDKEKLYHNIIEVHRENMAHGITSHKFFKRLLFDLCSSFKMPLSLSESTVRTISSSFHILLDNVRDPAYFILLCESFFSPGTTVPLLYRSDNSRSLVVCGTIIHLIFPAFVAGLARGTLSLGVISRCMDYLCAEPDRLFTVCRILSLDDIQKTEKALTEFASIAPTRTAWTARAHYMGVDPQYWPYLRPRTEDSEDEERAIAWVKDRMQAALAVLDKFFDSFDNPSPPKVKPLHILEEPNDIGAMSSDGPRLSPCRRVRDVVTSFRWAVSASQKPTIELSSSALSGAQAHGQDDPSTCTNTDAANPIQPCLPTIPPLSTRLRDALSAISCPSSSTSVDAV